MQKGLKPESQPMISSSNFGAVQSQVAFLTRHTEDTEVAFRPQSTTLKMADVARDRVFSSALASVLNNQESIKSLKTEQKTALNAFLLKKDVFATLPTGFGKSLIYQLAPLVAKEMKMNENPVVVVISPLLALMEQQVTEAKKLGVTAMQLGVNSEEDIWTGKPQLLFGGPEAWLLNDKWRQLLSTLTDLIGIVVDEVHLTYKWGQAEKGGSAFRESFAKLGELRSIVISGTPILALTATADIESRARVKRQLHLEEAMVITASPNRANIRLGLKTTGSSLDCLNWIVEEVKEKGLDMCPILVYGRTLKEVGRIYCYLKAELNQYAWFNQDPQQNPDNLLIGMFHSKTLPQNKRRVLSSLSGEGKCRVVVATTALGMGLNFPNISHVVMYGLPEDLEALVQEIGRAGRDGKLSHAVVYSVTQHTKVDELVRSMLQTSKNSCFRKALYSHFDEQVTEVSPGHLCCTYCQTICLCHPQGCKESTPVYERGQREMSALPERLVTKDDIEMLRELLEQYQSTLLEEGTHLYTNTTACTGFGSELIDAVVENSTNIFDVEYIINCIPVFKMQHAQNILRIINEVFNDIENCPVMSVMPAKSLPLDVDYTGYFDKEDTMDQDTPSTRSSESGVTALSISD